MPPCHVAASEVLGAFSVDGIAIPARRLAALAMAGGPMDPRGSGRIKFEPFACALYAVSIQVWC
jgi:hypothetical protein